MPSVDINELPIKDRPIKAGNDQADHFILFSSADGGKTFDRIRDFGDYGEMYMSLLRLQDKRLLLTFTVRDLKPPLGVRAIIGTETDDVLHDNEKFKLWFRKPGTNGFGYAESLDGVTFKQEADLQGINFAGDYTLAVEIDSAETDPQHRFQAGYDAPGMAAGIAHSADGIRWTP